MHDPLEFKDHFGLILNLAVVEHFNGSPLPFMQKVNSIAGSAGFLIFDVPNIASLSKRVRLLLGHSPLDEYARYIHSPYPYFGHNREMTVGEVKLLLTEAGFELQKSYTFNFNDYSTRTLVGELVRKLGGTKLFKNCGENIIAVCSTA